MFTFSIRARKDQKTKDGLHSIRLMATKGRKVKPINLGKYVSSDQWDFKKHGPTRKHPNKSKLEYYLSNVIKKANDIAIDYEIKGKNPSLDQFKDKFQGVRGEGVFSFIDSIIKELTDSNKIGYANKFINLKSTLEKFTTDVPVRSIDFNFLTGYEKSLRKNGSEDGGVNVNMRTLRAAFNKAIDMDVAEPNDYPFRRYKIVIPKVKKRAKKIDPIKQFLNYKYPEKFEKTLDLIKFSMLNQCINYVDIFYLSKDNVVNGRLEYFRKKNSKHPTHLSIKLLPESIRILEKYKYNFGTGESYEDYDKQRRKLSKQIIKMRELSETYFTFYAFRHSYATIARNDLGISKDVVSQLFGHKSKGVTEMYLSDYDNKVIDEANKKICDFIFE